MSAIGLVEMPHLTDAVTVLDVMLKTASVEFVTWEKKLGGRLVTIIVSGEVSAVKEAVEAALRSGNGRIVASAVIANPHGETMKMVQRSAAKFAVKLDRAEKKETEAVKEEAVQEETVRGVIEVEFEEEEGGNDDGTTGIGNGGDERIGSVD